MGVHFSWDDEEKNTVIRYTAEDDWNWNHYHKAVQMSLFALHRIGHDVDVIVDLSGTDKIPVGAMAHVRSFGKRQNPHLTGRAIVIGLDRDTELSLRGGDDSERVLHVGEQTIYFVDDEAAAQALLTQLRTD